MDSKFIWEDMVYRQLRGSPQDPVWHAEGDVEVHTRWVVKEMLKHEDFAQHPEALQDVLHRAVLLHDLGKPSCTQFEGRRVRNHGHSRKGASLARALLYGEGYDPVLREHVCALIRSHGVPMHAMGEDTDALRQRLLRLSLSLRSDFLAMVAEADNRGRISKASGSALGENIVKYRELAKMWGCESAPYEFPSDNSRFLYFQTGDASYLSRSPKSTHKSEMVMLVGLSGTHKAAWARANYKGEHLPIDSTISKGLQGAALQHLEAGRSFILNGHNTDFQVRKHWLTLAARYNVRTRIIYFEAPLPELVRRQETRNLKLKTKSDALFETLEDWSVPQLSEAHEVNYIYE